MPNREHTDILHRRRLSCILSGNHDVSNSCFLCIQYGRNHTANRSYRAIEPELAENKRTRRRCTARDKLSGDQQDAESNAEVEG
jgi:hypothetical protein